MRSSKLTKLGLVAAIAGLLTVGCGSPMYVAGTTAGASKASAGLYARDAEVGAETNMQNLNEAGDLDALEDSDLVELDATAASDDTNIDEAKAEAKVKSATKCGFVRSNTDGKFFLQITKGFLWWKRESSIPLSAADENVSLKVAADLNKKVLVRGQLQGETIVVKRVYKLLDFGQVWDLLSKGSLNGKVYNARTLVGIAHADVTVKSFATGRMWRTKSATDGTWKVGRLEAGEYEISAWSADFNLGGKDKVTVKKRTATRSNMGLQQEGTTSAPPPVK